MNKVFLILTCAWLLAISSSTGAPAQDTLYIGPDFAEFFDSMCTINGELLPVGTVIRAYDPDSVWCGVDTVDVSGKYIMYIYGDQSGTPALDEGASAGDSIWFTINGREAAIDLGDPAWFNQALLNQIRLSVSSTVAMSLINAPSDRPVAPGNIATFQVDVRNDGDGLDFYGVRLSMSVAGGTGPFNWEALEPDSLIYADTGETVGVFFSIRTPVFHTDTVNTIYWTVFSHVDTTVTVSDSLDVYMTITDVNDPEIALPGSFVLNQNYPNPFNPTTTISFNLSSRTAVLLDVIDITGRTVESRNLGVLPSGTHAVDFDASGLASGVYFYRLVTESAVESRKMILLK